MAGAKILFFLSALVSSHIECARILGVFPYPSKSHAILGQPIFVELAKRGHEVVFISPFPLKNPPKGFTDIVLTEKRIFDIYNEEMEKMFEIIDENPITMMKNMFVNNAEMIEAVIVDEAVQKLLNSKNEKFDLVFLDTLMDEGLLGFGAHFDAKMIGISTLGHIKYVNDLVHNPLPLSVVPHPFLPLTDRMTLSERIQNVLFSALEDFFMYWVHYPLQEKMYNKYFKPNKPSFQHMMKHSISLVFLNTHFSLNFPQAYLPNLIEIGGFHVKNETNPLPADLKSFIDSAEHGVIYFSLGSNLKPSKMDDEKKRDILAVLSKLKQKVIWKWDDETVAVDRSKILIKKWLPQDDILAHDNVKLFVTHGGLLSCIESIYRGKPVVGIPIFGDQSLNMARAEVLGWGVKVAYQDITEESLSTAINQVLSNPVYSENIKKVSQRLKDQPQDQMEKTIFWIEYVLRNDGAHFMQTSARYLNPIEYYNLDVYLIFAAVGLLIVLIPIFVVRKLLRCVFGGGKKVRKQKFN